MRRKFTGVLPPILTPLKSLDAIDVPALKRHVERLIRAGCHGIFVAGSTGEGPNLTMRAWQEAAEATVEAAAGRVPAYVGAIDVSLARTIEKLKLLKSPVYSAVVTPPFYFRHYGADLAEYFRRAAGESPVPVTIYNIPSMVGCEIPASVVKQAEAVERIIGVKDSSGDWSLMQTMLANRTRPDFEILCGAEPMMGAAMLWGADGIVPGAANFHPRLLVELYEAGRGGNIGETVELQNRLAGLREFFYVTSSPFVAMKAACRMLGLFGPATTFACADPTPEQERRIREILIREKLLPQ